MSAYLAGARELLVARRGVFAVVSCAREDGILTGIGQPRLAHFATARGWTIRRRAVVDSDVAAGDRTFDLLVLESPAA